MTYSLAKLAGAARHHNAHYITNHHAQTVTMQAAEVIGHNDDELRMLEALLGRKPPFDT